MIQHGTSQELGAHWDGDGVNFAVYSAHAERMVLCLFDESGKETHQLDLTGAQDGVWSGYLPGCRSGQRYGYRAYGRFEPADGHWFNPSKLLIDPYARELTNDFCWSDALMPFDVDGEADQRINPSDSAPFVPKAIVQGPVHTPPSRLHVPWANTILYEVNVRGYTKLHPAVPDEIAGSFAGMAAPGVLQHLKSLGVTSVELMPVHAFADERFLDEKGMRNYWGYNSLGFFAPASRYLRGASIDSFRMMVNALHDHGIEVILDVVYNHTAEGDHRGPTLSLRGLDNHTYYRLDSKNPRHYVNDTGCGNTVSMEHPRARALVLDSLRYWVSEMGVDGFRFDLAPILGRTESGFSNTHPFFVELRNDPVLNKVKLIAEPWDVGPGGYQLGRFPQNWAEWNDRFRDTIRRFWLTDHPVADDFARRIHGSADFFEASGRSPTASINMATAHDGYTLLDVVSYVERHNLANGELNRDGHRNNHSNNHGVEGPTDRADINALRRRQRLNLLACVLLGQGTPMLLGGDEFGNSQDGNNNAYCQDNETGWLDWSGVQADPEFLQQVQKLISIRNSEPLLRQTQYLHGQLRNEVGASNIEWLKPNGDLMQEGDWQHARCVTLLLRETRRTTPSRLGSVVLGICCNASHESIECVLPLPDQSGHWKGLFTSSGDSEVVVQEQIATLDSSTVSLLRWHPTDHPPS